MFERKTAMKASLLKTSIRRALRRFRTSFTSDTGRGNGKFASHLCVMALLVFCQFSGPTQADPLDQWTWRNPLPTARSPEGIAYGNNLFVAVGSAGMILTSPDGFTWTRGTSPAANSLHAITYADKQFVAVGDGVILTSPNGFNWAFRSYGFLNLRAITFANGQFVAVGGCPGRSTVVTSPDGITWTQRGVGSINSLYCLYGVTWGNNQFVVVGDSGTIVTSPDGVAWTHRSSVNKRVPCRRRLPEQSICGGGSWRNDTEFTRRLNWTNRSAGTSLAFRAITCHKDEFVVVGDWGTILTSPDTVNWTTRATGTYPALSCIAYGSEQLVAGGLEGTPILTSPDASTWTIRNWGWGDSFSSTLRAVCYGNNQFVVVGHGGTVLTSPDGSNWVNRRSGAIGILSAITYGNNRFVALSSVEGIVTSPDGITWSIGTGPYGLQAITFGNNEFVAVGFWGEIMASSDGISWVNRDSGFYAQLYGVAYGNNQFAAVGRGGTILSSHDGFTWTNPLTIVNNLSCITYGNNEFVTSGDWAGSDISRRYFLD